MDAMSGSVIVAGLPSAGGYFSEVKLVFMIALLLPWLYASAWVNKDALRVHASQPLWSAAVLGAGAVGVLLWLLIPWYLVGLVIYLAAVAAVIGVYAVTRNKRVVPAARVLTADHIRSAVTGLLGGKRRGEVEVVQLLKLYTNLGRPVFAPEADEPARREAYNLVQEFLNDVVTYRASAADMSPSGAQMDIRLVVDGVVEKRPGWDRKEAEKAIDFIKELAGADPAEQRRPQTGKIGMQAGAVMLDATVTTAGTTSGQRLQLKIEQEVVQTSLGELGMPNDLRERIEELNVAGGGGLMIVSSPSGNGATSTLYSLLRRHDAFMKQLETLEVKPAVDLENVTQHRYKGKALLAGELAKALRRDPDVVMIDECETPEAAALIVQAVTDPAGARKVLLGCVAPSSFHALARWIKVLGENRQAGLAALTAVTCQVLLRKLCPKCKEEYTPSQDRLAKLNLAGQKIGKFYRPPKGPLTDEKGRPMVCLTCRGTGYFGRTAAFELMEVTDAVRELAAAPSPSLEQIKTACRKDRMLYLQEQALRKVIEGVTSIEEVVRVFKPKK